MERVRKAKQYHCDGLIFQPRVVLLVHKTCGSTTYAKNQLAFEFENLYRSQSSTSPGEVRPYHKSNQSNKPDFHSVLQVNVTYVLKVYLV